MEKRDVKFVKLFPSEGKKLKLTVARRFSPNEPPIEIYVDDGHIIPEDELINVEEVSLEEWEEKRKSYCYGIATV